MALRNTSVVGVAFVAFTLLVATSAFAQFPGGFVELATSVDVRPPLTQVQIDALLPSRGLFTFPAPYLTQGVRLTNASDCDGGDCVNSVGSSYWRNTNNHVGSETMLLFLTLDRHRGGRGPTLFSYNKITDVVANVGPLFDPASPYSWASGEGWYFSATRSTTLYLNDGPRLLRYDVIAKTFETVLDVSLFGRNRTIWQVHSSNDDRVHSATLRDGTTFAELGCVAYREDTRQFFYVPQRGVFYDECRIDTSGRWLLINEPLGTDPVSEIDSRIIDLTAGVETDRLDRDGAGGLSDVGSGYMLTSDSWSPLPGAIRLWKFGTTPLGPGTVVYRDASWATLGARHVSHANTTSGVPAEQQYACGGGASRVNRPRANEVICFPLDGSLRVLVVAPVMTDMNLVGDSDSKLPKGSLDVTGQYFIWTSNMGRGRLDAFLVKVPAPLLTRRLPDDTPPTVAIVAPISGTSVAGTVTVSATATDHVGVVGVQFRLDGANLGAERMGSPYSVSWNTATAIPGAHTLTAVARDAAGNSAVSAPVSVTVPNANTIPLSAPSTAPKAGVTVRGSAATATATMGAVAGVIFESNWDTASGTSRNAVTDGGRWPLYWEFNNGAAVQLLSVVSGGPNGHNALRVQQRGPAYAANIQLDNFVLPSTDYYVRYYMRNDDTSSAGDHIVTADTWQYPNLTYMRKYSNGSSWRFVVSMYGCGYTYPIAHWGPTQRLSHGQWYRFEYSVHYTNANHIRVYPRVYDAAGNLLFSDADFKQQDYNAGGTWNGRSDWTLASYYAAGFDFCVDLTQLNRQGTGLAATSFGMGNNGNFGAVDTGLYWYFSALQIRNDTWPGPLGGGTLPLTFTDDPLVAQSTLIKALHILEARAAIDRVRLTRGLAPFAWTDRVLISGSTPVKAIHMLELRTALNQAYQAAGRTPPAYTDSTVLAGQTILTAVHLNELRTAVRALFDIPIPGTSLSSTARQAVAQVHSATCVPARFQR